MFDPPVSGNREYVILLLDIGERHKNTLAGFFSSSEFHYYVGYVSFAINEVPLQIEAVTVGFHIVEPYLISGSTLHKYKHRRSDARVWVENTSRHRDHGLELTILQQPPPRLFRAS